MLTAQISHDMPIASALAPRSSPAKAAATRKSYRFTIHLNYRFVPVEQKELLCRMNNKVKDHSYSVGFARGGSACTRLSYFPLRLHTNPIRSSVQLCNQLYATYAPYAR
jgi:hypothetical protein